MLTAVVLFTSFFRKYGTLFDQEINNCNRNECEILEKTIKTDVKSSPSGVAVGEILIEGIKSLNDNHVMAVAGDQSCYIFEYRIIAAVLWHDSKQDNRAMADMRSQLADRFAGVPPEGRVVDFGCAEGNFVKFLKNVLHVKEISAVDLEFSSCMSCVNKSRPIAWDHIMMRPNPLKIKIFHGSVLKNDFRLKNYDAVTCIELIEHLHPVNLKEFSDNIFGFIKPSLVILTTPNSDFNVLFSNPKTFRHWDHKFEWSRKEFIDWCDNIVKEFPSYQYNIEYIGKGPDGSEHLGGCSQMCIFENESKRSTIQNSQDGTTTPTINEYTLVDEFIYPIQDNKARKEFEFVDYSETDSVSSSENDENLGALESTSPISFDDLDEEEWWD
ncbi:Small RNA 2'-O-methyltransferase [Nymphon striatum]|nr:Small RNA 2'-O-methyltransferase [Nymphon striatum]